MKIIFFGTTVTSARSGHHARVLRTLIDGTVDRGHHVVFVESVEGGAHANDPHFCKVLRYTDWSAFRPGVEEECATASAIVVTSGFAPGADAVDWLLELPVRAHCYYDLDPWETLRAFDAEGSAPWLRADQIAEFDIVFSLAGGPAPESFKRIGAREVATLYEAIDPAVFHPRAASPEMASEMVLVADKEASVEGILDEYVFATAKALPDNRFIIAGKGWKIAADWPENVELWEASDAVSRAELYSSARLALVPVHSESIDYAMPIELLEPAACGAACAVINRPGLAELFKRDHEILVLDRGPDLLPLLSARADDRLVALGNAVEKRVLIDYTKLRRGTQFEQRVAKKFFGA